MSRSKNKRIIGITLGDPAGIGPEITLKALKQLPPSLAEFVIIGDAAILQKHKIQAHIEDLRNPFVSHIRAGHPSRQSAQAALNYLNRAITLLKNKRIDALVTAPLSKEYIANLGVTFEGHTEYLARAFKTKNFGMMFVGPHLRTIIVTRHLAVKNVPNALNKTNIFDTIELTDNTLKKLFHIKHPRIGVCGLNPHAGEGGKIGKEEITKIIPAMKLAKAHGIAVQGPFPADTLFAMDRYKQFDAIVAMYHDQGLIPVKTLFFDQLVNLTVGLPFIRTSPAHGTAFDIAGKNKANHLSMTEAIKLAVRLS